VRQPADLERDRALLLEGADFTDKDDSQVVSRIQFDSPEERWLAHLILVSGMVRHMELVPDEDKRRVLAGALEGWVQFTANSLGIVAALAKDRRVTLNGIVYRTTLGDDMPVGEAARRMALTMPIASARMAALFIGTEKLRLQLQSGIGSEEHGPAEQFLRFAILADLGVGNLADLAEQVANQSRDSRFLRHVLMRKLYEIAIRFRLPKDQLDDIKNIVSDMIISLQRARHNSSNKSKVLKTMTQQRLLLTNQSIAIDHRRRPQRPGKTGNR
jgi:hypothetical protein